MKKTKTTPPTDPVIDGCLSRINRGYVDAMYVLRDYLLEIGHPLAQNVHDIAESHRHKVMQYLTGRRRPRLRWWNVCREIGVSHLGAIRLVAMVFEKEWKLVWGRVYDRRRHKLVGRYRTAWTGTAIDRSYDRNHTWLQGVRGTITAAAS
jgi:hypothetical protein